MRAHSVVVSTASGDAWAFVSDALRQHWPRNEKPRVDWLGPDDLRARLESSRGAWPDVVVLAMDESATHRDVDRVVQELHAKNIPGVCLIPAYAEWRKFQRHGVVFEPPNLDPRVLASYVYALSERQLAVDQLSRELFVCQRAQEGAREELDKLHEEMSLAAGVQREFLPREMPRMDGLQVGAVFRPAASVSGDIYSVERVDDEHVSFFIADAVGHGVPAALLTMVLCHALATLEHRGIPSPADAMRRLNERLCGSGASGARLGGGAAAGRFATAIYGVVHAPTGRMRLAGAGHPPPLLVGPAGTRLITTDGPLLGVFPDAEFGEIEAELSPGSTMLIYTDGLEWAFPDAALAPGQRRRTNTRYLDHLARLAAQDDTGVDGFIRRLHDLLDEQSGSLHQVDDVTALAIASPARAAGLRRAA